MHSINSPVAATIKCRFHVSIIYCTWTTICPPYLGTLHGFSLLEIKFRLKEHTPCPTHRPNAPTSVIPPQPTTGAHRLRTSLFARQSYPLNMLSPCFSPIKDSSKNLGQGKTYNLLYWYLQPLWQWRFESKVNQAASSSRESIFATKKNHWRVHMLHLVLLHTIPSPNAKLLVSLNQKSNDSTKNFSIVLTQLWLINLTVYHFQILYCCFHVHL